MGRIFERAFLGDKGALVCQTHCQHGLSLLVVPRYLPARGFVGWAGPMQESSLHQDIFKRLAG
ncbi:hypothetical protein PS691_04833 [Pseudomonas fluorescens]|uniref:Uncharacterized protein n=1 Tax=Pseudomonas fluorescens TaxID=294 RepID=A0A5E7ETM3_PSEFL|nr:hypothetical protein PS691_04833 [Pseudomonas fluorescens]